MVSTRHQWYKWIATYIPYIIICTYKVVLNAKRWATTLAVAQCTFRVAALPETLPPPACADAVHRHAHGVGQAVARAQWPCTHDPLPAHLWGTQHADRASGQP